MYPERERCHQSNPWKEGKLSKKLKQEIILIIFTIFIFEIPNFGIAVACSLEGGAGQVLRAGHPLCFFWFSTKNMKINKLN